MIKRIMSYIPAVGVPIVINFVLMYLYSGSMDPAEYGVLNIYMNTISLLYSLFLSFFQSAALRFYSIKEINQDERTFYSTYVFGNIIVTIVAFFIMFVVNMVLIQFDYITIAAAIGINALYQFDLNYYRLQNEDKKYIIGKTATSVLTLVFFLVIYMIMTKMNYRSTLVSVYGSYFLLVMIELFRNRNKLSFNSISLGLVKESLLYGIPMVGVSIAGILVANSDQYVLLHFLGEEAVGEYSLGYRISDSFIVNITLLILTVMTPELMRIYDQKGQSDGQVVLRKMINFNTWTTLPLVGASIVYAPYIINFVFPKYNGATEIMKLVVIASFFHGLSLFTCKPLELARKTTTLLWLLLITAAVNFLYNIVFIPIYGVNASAHSSIIAYITYNVLLICSAKRYMVVDFDVFYLIKNIAITLVTIILAMIILKAWKINSIGILVVQILLCAVSYIILSVGFKLFSLSE